MTKTPLEVIQEGQKTLNGEFARWQGDIVWHNANILALLQALRAELEGRKNEHCGGRKDCARGQCLTIKIRNKTIQDQIDSLDALIKELTK